MPDDAIETPIISERQGTETWEENLDWVAGLEANVNRRMLTWGGKKATRVRKKLGHWEKGGDERGPGSTRRTGSLC